MNLQKILDTHATDQIKEEIEALLEASYTLMESWLMTADRLIDDEQYEATRKTKTAIKRIQIESGQYKFITDEEYDSIQSFGGSKAADHPKLDGKRMSLTMTNEAMESSYWYL
jgi:hypothetical protein